MLKNYPPAYSHNPPMYYDPVKDIFASLIKKIPLLRILFYKILDLMFLRSWYVRRELRNIRKIFGSERISVYDAGTGYAQYTYFMSEHLLPAEIYAVDIKDNWIQDAKEFFRNRGIKNVTFGIEDLTRISHSSKFDLILCVDVMEHIEDDVKVFDNFFNALKPGGFLVINTPSVYGGSDVHSGEDESFIGEHAREGYSFEDLRDKLIPSGFSVYNYRYTYGFWGDKAWRLGIKYPMLMINASKILFIVLPFYYLLTLPFTLLFMYIDYVSRNKIGSGINFIARK